jgi:hypothetical protein
MSLLRPLTKDERALLRAQVRPFGLEVVKGFFFGLLFFGGLLSILLQLLWKWIAPVLDVSDAGQYKILVFLTAMLITVVCLIPAALSARRFGRKLAPRQKMAREDLKSGQAATAEYAVTQAFELPESEDEGTGYFLELSDSRILYVQGQDLYPDEPEDMPADAAATAKFPAASIHYSYGPKSGVRLGITPTGAYLPPRRLQARRYRSNDAIPEDGTFYTQGAEAVMQLFKLKFADAAEKS